MGGVNDQLSRYPIDVENVAEMDRLIKQAQVITKHIGLYPAQMRPTKGQTILDVGCGPGEWVLEVAEKNPDCRVVGIDISQSMVNYANSCVRVRRLLNARFKNADACQTLPFPDMSFDIVNARFLTWFLQKTTWPVFLAECHRILRPGGMMCSTEGECLGITNSPALANYSQLITCYLRKGKHCFTQDGPYIGITAVQEHLLRKSGFNYIHQQVSGMNYSAGTPALPVIIEDFAALMPLMEPALQREKVVDPEELAQLHTQVLAEMHMDDFCALGFFQTTWGTKE